MKKGFTIFELILVVAMIAILAVASLPVFFDISERSIVATSEAVVGAVRDALEIYRANEMAVTVGNGSYPPTLDSNPSGSTCETCFSGILENGLKDSSWTKVSNSEYTFNDRKTITTYTYNSTSGTFAPSM